MRRAAQAVVAAVLAAALLPVAGQTAEGQEDRCADAPAAPVADRDAIAPTHREAVDCLWHLGIVEGRPGPDGRTVFDPRRATSRGHLVAMLHRLLEELGRAEGLPAPQRPRFHDVPADHVFDEPVHRLAAADVVRGIDERTFGPGRAVRRDQQASLVLRAVAWATERTLAASAGPYFGDVPSRSVHRAAIDAAFEHRLVEGTRRPCGDAGGRFSPDRHLQRQQAATVLVRVLEAFDAIDRGEGGDQRGDAECPSPQWSPRVVEAREYAQARAGSVSFAAIGTDGEMVGYRSSTQVPAASVIKVMFLVAYLREPDVRDRSLRQADRDLLEPMIRRSANEPATTIADRLGPEPINRLAERAGMRDFSYTRPWGASRVSARDQAAFMLDLPRTLPRRHRDYALDLLTGIVSSQQWGVGQVATPGWAKHFKGGWGSGTGAVNHQVVLLRSGDGTRVSLAVMITDSPSHDHSAATLEGVFRRLLGDLPDS